MQKFPWKPIGISSAVLTLLVVIRCVVTVGRVLYYGGNYWSTTLAQDPWFYIGMVAAAICVTSFVMLAVGERKKDSRCEA